MFVFVCVCVCVCVCTHREEGILDVGIDYPNIHESGLR